MKKEFCLSDKVFCGLSNSAIHIIDVKEFIKLLKEELRQDGHLFVDKIINKLAGDKLNSSDKVDSANKEKI